MEYKKVIQSINRTISDAMGRGKFSIEFKYNLFKSPSETGLDHNIFLFNHYTRFGYRVLWNKENHRLRISWNLGPSRDHDDYGDVDDPNDQSNMKN